MMCSTFIADNFINNRQTINEYSFEFLHYITGYINDALNRYLFFISAMIFFAFVGFYVIKFWKFCLQYICVRLHK